jgi:hypothetical protein
MVAKIGTGEVTDSATSPIKAHHGAGGKTGGQARTKVLRTVERSEIAKKAVAKRSERNGK